MSFDVSTWGEATASGAPMPSARVTVRVMREAVEESLMSFTRVKLEEVLPTTFSCHRRQIRWRTTQLSAR